MIRLNAAFSADLTTEKLPRDVHLQTITTSTGLMRQAGIIYPD